MCDYCGCRSRSLLQALGADHARITALAGAVRRAATSDRAAATAALTELTAVLEPHSALEEGGLYPALAAHGLPIDALVGDHTAIDSTIRAAADGSETAWASLPAALDRLARHIEAEEYDLFPAAHQLLSDLAWDAVDQHHIDHRPDHSHPPDHSHRPAGG